MNKYPVTSTDQVPGHFCPYCGLNADASSLEHIIPESIGGTKHTSIFVCGGCNHTIGSKIDSRLAKCQHIALVAMSQGIHGSGVPGTGRLKDGTVLHGRVFSVGERRRTMSPGFIPDVQQPDGSKWLSETTLKDGKLPSGFKFYREESLDATGYHADGFPDKSLEAPFAKIALGFCHLLHGEALTSSNAIVPLRKTVWESLAREISIAEINEDDLPDNLDDAHNHACYFDSETKGFFKIGVLLFRTFGYEFVIGSRGLSFPSRMIRVNRV